MCVCCAATQCAWPGRSIYPDEFDNFVERMRLISKSKSKDFPFDIDVMDPLLTVALDTDLGADVSREGCVRYYPFLAVCLLLSDRFFSFLLFSLRIYLAGYFWILLRIVG